MTNKEEELRMQHMQFFGKYYKWIRDGMTLDDIPFHAELSEDGLSAILRYPKTGFEKDYQGEPEKTDLIAHIAYVDGKHQIYIKEEIFEKTNPGEDYKKKR